MAGIGHFNQNASFSGQISSGNGFAGGSAGAGSEEWSGGWGIKYVYVVAGERLSESWYGKGVRIGTNVRSTRYDTGERSTANFCSTTENRY